MKKFKYNITPIPDDCWSIVVEFIANIHDLNSFEFTCRTFYFIVKRLYDIHFGKKLYDNVGEFMKSKNFKSDYDNFEPNKKFTWIHYNEESSDYLNSPIVDDLLTLFTLFCDFEEYYRHRQIYIENGEYKYYQLERVIFKKNYCEDSDEESDGLENTVESTRIIVEKDFKKFVQRIKGYFFI